MWVRLRPPRFGAQHASGHDDRSLHIAKSVFKSYAGLLLLRNADGATLRRDAIR
jgi:hypothetical protein